MRKEQRYWEQIPEHVQTTSTVITVYVVNIYDMRKVTFSVFCSH